MIATVNAIDKRQLRRYTPPKIKCKPQGYTVQAERFGDFLCVNFYINNHHDFTVFCSAENFITKCASRTSNGWSGACLFNLIYWQPEYGDETANGFKISYADCKSERAGTEFFGREDIDTLSALHDFQIQIKPEVRKAVERAPEMVELTKRMSEIPPTEVECKWADEHLMKEYRYGYAKRYGKKILGVCSHCGKEAEFASAVKGRLAGKKGKCLNCKSTVTFRAANFTYQVDPGFFQTIVPMKNGIAVKQYDIDYIQRQGKQVEKKYSCHEIEYIGYNLKTVLYGDLTYNYLGAKYCRWHTVTGICRSYYGYCANSSVGARPLYPIGVDKALTGTPFGETLIGKTAAHSVEYLVDVDVYLNRYKYNPLFESAVKVGLYKLCVGGEYDLFNTKKTLKKALGVSSAQLAQLRRFDVSVNTYNTLKKIWQFCTPQISDDLIKKILKSGLSDFLRIRNFEFFDVIKTELRLTQLCDYLAKHPKAEQDYGDYIHQLKLLGRDTTQASELFPKDFEKRHTEFAAQIECEKNASLDKQIAEVAEKNQRIYRYESGEYIFCLPKTAAEIICEGKNLHHCVGMYCDKVANGECVIVFCRKKGEPDKSFATGEFKGAESIQFRAECNHKPPSSAVKAWEELKKHVKKEIAKMENEKVRIAV